MKPVIEKPHIFISYAWGTKEHQDKVLELATSLVKDGIDVELDKWSLKEGNDTYSFMEQMVNNSEITNVLILLDQNYQKKADARQGGVGTETQIISPELYNKTNQEKFIPVVFERGEDDKIYKPAYLKGILHFDLSKEETYFDEYQRLVKRLYGINIIKKPEVGTKPDWVENENVVNVNLEFKNLTKARNEKEKVYLIKQYFDSIKNEICSYNYNRELNNAGYIESYKNLQSFRDKILILIKKEMWEECLPEIISEFLEDTYNSIKFNDSLKSHKNSLVHEILIYIIGLYYKINDYKSISYLLGKSYCDNTKTRELDNYNIFYEWNYNLNNSVNARDNKNYYSGTAQLWMETINTTILTKNEFVLADILLYNYSVLGKNYHSHTWFPISYVYFERIDSEISKIRKKLGSYEFALKLACLFGHKTIDELKKSISSLQEDIKKGAYRDYRYSGSFYDAPLITDDIKIENIGIYA